PPLIPPRTTDRASSPTRNILPPRNGKPVERRGRKAMGLPRARRARHGRQVAERNTPGHAPQRGPRAQTATATESPPCLLSLFARPKFLVSNLAARRTRPRRT